MVAAAAISLALVGSAVACSSDADDTSGVGTTSTTASDSNRSFEVSTADGQISLSLDGNLPSGWPESFPVPDGATPSGSGSFVNGNSGKLVGVFTTSESPQDTFDFYKSSTAFTVDDQKSAGVGSAYVGSVELSGTYEGRVTVLSRGGSTTIVIALDPGSDTNTSGTDPTDTSVVP
jgi:hypothetical protein